MRRETYNLELWRRTTKTTQSILQVSHWTNSSCTRSDLVMCMYIGTSVEITANKVWWTGTKKRKREKRMKSCWLLKVISLKSFFFPLRTFTLLKIFINITGWCMCTKKVAVCIKRGLTRTIQSAHWIQMGHLILCHRFAWINNCKIENFILYFVKLPWPIWVLNSETKNFVLSLFIFTFKSNVHIKC